MNWKSTAAVSGVTLLATWLGSTPVSPPAATQADASAGAVRSQAASDIQDQAARLQTRVRTELEYHNPKRNPFRFTERPAVIARQPVAAPPIAVPVTTGPPPLPFALSGMAANMVDGQAQLTAILTSNGDVVFVTAGDRIGGYTVTGVDEAGVDVTAADGSVRRLTLTP